MLAKLRPTEDMSANENNYHAQIERILQQLYRRAGGTVDNVDDNTEESSANENQISHIYGLVAELTDEINALAADSTGVTYHPGFRAVTKSEDYTANNLDFVNAKLGATISLPQYPEENAVVIIRNGDGSTIKLNGNGKTINGSTTGKLYRKGTAIVWQYFIDSDEWLAR
jgi:hypothetical protein